MPPAPAEGSARPGAANSGKRGAALQALRAARARGDAVSNTQLAEAAGYRFGARLAELRDLGFEIGVEQTARGAFWYRLDYDPEREPPRTLF